MADDPDIAPRTIDAEVLYDLRARCFGAAKSLHTLADGQPNRYERHRLSAKAQGVDLALSYLDEVIRDSPK